MPLATRRSFLKSCFASTALFATWACAPAPKKPNIILIMADDLGYGDLGCYGSEWIETPNIDAMAAEGLQFSDYHSNGAVCTPTRAALLTGRYQQRAGLEGVITVAPQSRINGLDPEEYTFAEALKTTGYHTCIVGKWHLGYDKMYNPVHQGFDEFRGYVSGNVDYLSHFDNSGVYDWWHNLELVQEDGYVTDLITNHAVNYIVENQDRPFCLYVAHESPHWPYQGRDSKADRYEGSSPPEAPARGTDPDPKAAFKEMIEVMDEGVGQIIRTVKERGLDKNTLIFFCSDNGGDPPWGSNGNLRGHKGRLWEGGHRVPAIARWPGRIKPGHTSQLAMSMDIFPSLLNICNVSQKPPRPLDGVDLSPLLFEQENLATRAVFWRFKNQRVARQGPWKLLVQDGQRHLFNLYKDVDEANNLAGIHPDIVDNLIYLLSEWEKDVPSQQQQKVL